MSKDERLDAVFEDYTGRKRFEVFCLGKRKALRVAAPNEDAAIVAAAKAIGVRWQKYDFYAFCKVFPA